MGNRMCGGWSRRGPLEERLTRPQRLARQPSGVDYKKLRNLILSQKLAPCFDALDDPNLLADLEECPICFFYYPSLNRSRCCAKGICTECFVQMKPSDTAHPAQCPFCKSSCYAVEYRGARTEEEKILERVEEQKVIEAKIRMQSEAQIEERVMHVEQPHSLLEIIHAQSNFGEPSCGLIEGTDIEETWASVMRENIMVDGSSDPSTCCTRHEELNADLEEIMVMEAIWQSLQNCRLHKSEISQTSGWSETVGTSRDSSSSDTSFPCDQGESSSSHSSADGVAVAIARLAEGHLQQHQVSEQDCVRAQTSEELCEYFVEGSNRTQSEIGSNMTQMRLLQ